MTSLRYIAIAAAMLATNAEVISAGASEISRAIGFFRGGWSRYDKTRHKLLMVNGEPGLAGHHPTSQSETGDGPADRSQVGFRKTSSREIAGRTLSEWRNVISRLPLNDPASAQYVSGLIQLEDDAQVPWITRRQAALTLGRLGEISAEAVPHFQRFLADSLTPPVEKVPLSESDEALRNERILWSVKAIGLYGALAAESVELLIAIYEQGDGSSLLRFAILESLSQTGKHDPAAIQFLMRLAEARPVDQKVAERDQRFTNDDFRRAAIEALGVIGATATTAVPLLLRSLDDPDANIRREAVQALGLIGPPEEFVTLPLIERLMADTDEAVQDRAAQALISLGPVATASPLVSLLSEADDSGRIRILGVLAGWGSTARPWLPAVRPLVNSDAADIRLAACHAIWQITNNAASVALDIVREFAHPEHAVRREAFRMFGRLGSGRRTARPVLIELSRDDDPETRKLAKKALAQLQNEE